MVGLVCVETGRGAYGKVVNGDAVGLELDVVVVGGLHQDGVHAGGEVGKQVSVGPFEDAVLGRDQATSCFQRDGDDQQRGVEDAGGIVGEQVGQGVRLVV